MLGFRLFLAGLVLLAAARAQAEPPADAPPPPRYETVVTALRLPRPLPDVPSAIVVIPRDELERTPATAADDLVRLASVAGTFRRTPSLLADPTAQGLSLRAVGPSGVSRALVLVDGVPANDPFGGWVYWRALPRLGLERIEVVPGGSSALYGNFGLGGVVQLVSRPLDRAVEADLAGGNLGTGLVNARAAGRTERLAGGIEIDGLRSAGYVPVAPAQRGAIDRAGESHHLGGTARGELTLAGTRIGARAGAFTEDQNGGTALTTASVRSGTYALDARRALAGGELQVALAGSVERFRQTRPRIMPGRGAESVAAEQEVRSHGEGASLLWSSGALRFAGAHHLLLGGDLRRVVGTSEEAITPAMPAAAAVVARRAGGEQRFLGVFAEDVYAPVSALELSLAVRADAWQNRAGERRTTRMDGGEAHEGYVDRSVLELSPRFGFLVRTSESTRVRGSAYRAFRAPTLNELYRPFQVGTILTAGNAALSAERLLGAELGVELLLPPASSLRLTGFVNRLSHPIANVTLAEPLPDGAARQRQNLGAVSSRGLDLAADAHLPAGFLLTLGYTLVAARVSAAPAQPALVEREIAQIPRHRARLGIGWERGRVTATLQSRAQSRVFEDDLNQLPMNGFVVLDAHLGVTITRSLSLFASAQNLLNHRYLVGRAGVDTIGPPLFALVGARLR